MCINPWARRWVGAADRNRLAGTLRQLDDLQGIELLGQHAAGHDDVGPGEISVLQLLGIAVDEANIP